MKKSFIEKTAKEYDMDFEDVRRIYQKYRSDLFNQNILCFYEDLEIFIKNRAEELTQ